MIDIIIPIWNISNTPRERLFLRTLESIDMKSFNIKIADFGINDKDYKAFKQFTNSYYIECHEDSFEKAYKVNRAVKELINHDEVFICIDSDTLVPSDLKKLFDNQIDYSKEYLFGNFKLVSNFLPGQFDLKSHIFMSHQIEKLSEKVFTCGDTWFTNKRTFNYVGGFDENFKLWGVEDIELFQRIHKFGIQFQFLDINCGKQVHNFTYPDYDLKKEGEIVNSLYYYKKYNGHIFHLDETIQKVIDRATRHRTQVAREESAKLSS